jgi:hypothetical protein
MTDAAKTTEDDAIGCAERDVGRYVYARIEALMDAKPGTPQEAELRYLSRGIIPLTK